MPSQNVETVRRHLEAWRSGDSEGALAYMSEDVEFDARTRPDGKVWQGHAGVREAIREWREIWEEYELRAGELIDAGPDRVVALWSETGRARRSGALMSEQGATVFTLADGTISNVLVSVDVPGVLASLGLTADPHSSG